MKFCTIWVGLQPGWGGLMICAQHRVPCCWPPTLAGSLADCSGPLTGTSAQPATAASAASGDHQPAQQRAPVSHWPGPPRPGRPASVAANPEPGGPGR